MAVALLLIGWVNALNLTIARYLERGREFGLRKVFGASRRQIVVQGLLESGLLNLSALFFGTWLVGSLAAGCLSLGRAGFCFRCVGIAGVLGHDNPDICRRGSVHRVLSLLFAHAYQAFGYYAGKAAA